MIYLRHQRIFVLIKFSLIQKFQKLETNWLAKGGYEVIGKLGGRPRTSNGGR